MARTAYQAGSWISAEGGKVLQLELQHLQIPADVSAIWLSASISRFQPGTKRWDRILLALMLAAMVAEIPVATLDAGRMFWSNVPFSIVVLGNVLIAAGIALGAWAQAVNRFFELGVRIQRERGQHVITSGPYKFVRHPGYASAIMISSVCRFRSHHGGRWSRPLSRARS